MCTELAPTLLITCVLYFALRSVTPESVTLFEDKNFGGKKCEIEVKGCQPVCDGMDDKTSSLQGNASCVYFYREKNCTAYMGFWNSTIGDVTDMKNAPEQDSISSVGDCDQPVDPDNSITFWENKNFRGQRCNIVKGCQPMCPELDKKSSSAEGDVACVKLYTGPNCAGFIQQLDFSTDSYSDWKGSDLQDAVSSLGDCDQSSK